jgi:KaiC/GvpD/RAD55 family RecA-like ATPase
MKDYKQIKHGFVILAEHSADAYFMELAGGLKQIIKRGYAGVYVNSQRPFNNLSSMLKRHKVDTKKLVFIDFTASLEKFKYSKNERYIRIAPSIGFEHLSLAIRESLLKLKSKKKFVFLDSITTLQLYDISEKVLYRFYEFLMDTARKGQSTLILNVSQGMAKKPFIRDLAFFVDMQIS